MSEPRAALLGLINYLGLSLGEAAGLIGIGHDTLSKKLAGKGRYDVRNSEIETLRQLADTVDRMVSGAVVQIERLCERRPPGVEGDPEICLLIYRHDPDLPAWAGLPHASVHRLSMARIARTLGAVQLVTFDRDSYDAWRGSRSDDQQTRSDWAADRRRDRPGAISLKWRRTVPEMVSGPPAADAAPR